MVFFSLIFMMGSLIKFMVGSIMNVRGERIILLYSGVPIKDLRPESCNHVQSNNFECKKSPIARFNIPGLGYLG